MRLAMTAPVVERSTKRRTRLPSITPSRAGRDREHDVGRRQARHHGLDLVGHSRRRAARRGAERDEPVDRLTPGVEDGDPVAGLDQPAGHVEAHLAEPDEADIHVRLSLAIALCAVNLARIPIGLRNSLDGLGRRRCDLRQQIQQCLRRGDVRVMAGVDLEIAPAAFALGALGELAEHVRRSASLAIDVAAGRRRGVAGETKRLLERPDRLRPPAARRPGDVGIGRVSAGICVGGRRQPSPSVRASSRMRAAGLRRLQVEQALAVAGRRRRRDRRAARCVRARGRRRRSPPCRRSCARSARRRADPRSPVRRSRQRCGCRDRSPGSPDARARRGRCRSASTARGRRPAAAGAFSSRPSRPTRRHGRQRTRSRSHSLRLAGTGRERAARGALPSFTRTLSRPADMFKPLILISRLTAPIREAHGRSLRTPSVAIFAPSRHGRKPTTGEVSWPGRTWSKCCR